MVIINVVGLLFFFISFLLTIPYGKNKRKQINKKKHKLWMLYGLSMFLMDRMPLKLKKGNSSMNKSIREICVKEDIHKERYLYYVEKISISLCVLLITLILGVLICLTEQAENSKTIKELKREQFKDTSYHFLAQKENGETEEIELNVHQQEMSEEEIRIFLEGKKEELMTVFLGENQSVNQVRKPLNFVSSFGEKNIFVDWELENTAWIDYEGNLSDNIPQKGQIVPIKATITLEKVSVIYDFCIFVYPKEYKKSLQSELQNYVDENELNQDAVVLPENIDGKKVSYFQEISQIGQWIFPIGFLISIFLFFLKDKDLKKKIDERNIQMEKDYPEIVSQILLYYGAGLSMKSTLEKIIEGYNTEKNTRVNFYRFAYEELDMTLTKMKSGVSEIAAINDFGNRCGLQNYMKLSGIIEQNQRRGTNELSLALKAELNNAMVERKNRALKNGSEISVKLLGPMILMLIIVLVIIMVPAFMSMNIN